MRTLGRQFCIFGYLYIYIYICLTLSFTSSTQDFLVAVRNECQFHQWVHHWLLAATLVYFYFLFFAWCKQSASLSMCRGTHNLNRTGHEGSVGHPEPGETKSFETHPFFCAIDGRRFQIFVQCVHTHLQMIRFKHKATQCSHYAVDHLRSVSSQGHNLPTFSLQPSMAWLGYGLTRLVDILQQSAVSKVYTLLTLPSKTPGRTEDRMRSDRPKCNWAPSDQWNNIKHHCRQHETAEFAQFCTRFTLAGTTYVANGARSAQEWCQWRRVPD